MNTPKRIFFESYNKECQNREVTKMVIAIKNYHGEPEIIITSALTRKESRGLHYNLDYPKTNSKAEDTIINIDVKNNIKLYQEK